MRKFTFLITFLVLINQLFAVSPSEKVKIVYKDNGVAQYVNPLIGTDSDGFNFPGAASPWGMTSASPHTSYTSPLDYLDEKKRAPTGYRFGQPEIDGFGQTHLSGVACPELGAPVLGMTSKKMTPGNYKSSYSEEIVKVGYYAAKLDDIDAMVETTTSPRATVYQIDFKSDDANFLVLDTYKNLSWQQRRGFIKKVDDQSFEGYAETGNFCFQFENLQKIYFYLHTYTDSDDRGIWKNKGKIRKNESAGNVGAWLQYNGPTKVYVGIGISYVSSANAKENLEAEIGSKLFDDVLNENVQRWEKTLGKVKIGDAGRDTDKTIFYTALYHSLIHPNIVSDVNGQYPLYESEGYGEDKSHEYYGLFSLWDTYRNVHPLLSLVYPEQQQDMYLTLEKMTMQAGHPPRWELHGSEIDIMVGDPAISVITEGIVKGFKFNNKEKLFEVLYKNARDNGKDTWRPGNKERLEYGYIPEKTSKVWGSVSTTLEFSYADWALASYGKQIGYDEESEVLFNQASQWTKLYRKDLKLICPKDKKGEWMKNLDPDAMEGSRSYGENAGGPGYAEGNSYQYTYMVPHDLQTLVDLMGGMDSFITQLKFIFEEDKFSLWNEPDMLYPYIFGLDHDQVAYMQNILKHLRSDNFYNKPDGLPGNDDSGTLSAWYVFSALGFYPVNPADANYWLGVPMFDNIQINVPETNTKLVLKNKFNSKSDAWNEVYFNGSKMKDLRLTHKQLKSGGKIEFVKE